MAIITLLTDFGTSDHYVAAIKAKIYSLDQTIDVFDISHNIEHFNISHGSFVLKSVFRDFPEGTVHLVSVNSFSNVKDPFIVLYLEGHYFIGTDNGFSSLISEKEPDKAVLIHHEFNSRSSFPEKDIFVPIAVKIVQGVSLDEIGTSHPPKMMIGRKVKATKKQISGNIVRIDHYGNLITNIEREVFDFLSEDKTYSLVFGRENIKMIHRSYNSVDDGDVFAVFNSLGLLEIGINKGNASELLGLKFDSTVNIFFSE